MSDMALARRWPPFISASGGASVGQYGPLVHFGATMGSFIRQHYWLEDNYRCLYRLRCGWSYSGWLQLRQLPVVVFAHEAILRHFSLRAIAPIAIASITCVVGQ
jgi:CIC family chloride channel protein